MISFGTNKKIQRTLKKSRFCQAEMELSYTQTVKEIVHLFTAQNAFERGPFHVTTFLNWFKMITKY